MKYTHSSCADRRKLMADAVASGRSAASVARDFNVNVVTVYKAIRERNPTQNFSTRGNTMPWVPFPWPNEPEETP